jgi:poly-gamma-glutamate capsule biosynthesis protein CapA/YwtB (metallophosphatase superfamily)
MEITIFMCGDVMTGRGIDQILPHPVDPTLYEPCIRDARVYVGLAEERTGPIAAPVAFEDVWGDALQVLERLGPAVRLINLETSITTSDVPWKGKSIHYRMHPANTGCLTSAGIDGCVLANNHLLDWGYAGLDETVRTLQQLGIETAGAGRDADHAAAPAVLTVPEVGRILVLAFGSPTSGVPHDWAAAPGKSGVNFLPELSEQAVCGVATLVERHAREGDIVIVSGHWGGNWGYAIPEEQIAFAHRLIDRAGVDIVHGHSSHHVKGLEVYEGRLILYGCGDFLNDYEGIGGYEWYRSDLTLMYLPTVEAATGALIGLRLVPLRIRHFRLNGADRSDAIWLRDILNRESRGVGVQVEMRDDGMLAVHWD